MLACTPEHLVGVLGSSPVLSIAHPGHEMRVYGIVRAVRPTACVLTDGSGGAGRPRIGTCRALLDRLSVPVGPLFGRYSDRDFYDLILAGSTAPFVELVYALTHCFVQAGATAVLGDAVEGFNTAHDLLCDLTNIAVLRAERGLDRTVPRLVFPLVGTPDSYLEYPPGVCVELDSSTLNEKLDVANAYEGLQYDVQQAVLMHGTASFRRECLWRVKPDGPLHPTGNLCYEAFAQDRVRSGRYQTPITRAHIEAISAKVWHMIK